MRVTRTYEVLQDDNTWKAASELHLGDIVRISLIVTTKRAGCRNVAIEDNMGKEDSFQATYLARIVRTGEATAPPAKAELMYEPQVYGLSLSERLFITPGKEEK